MLASWILHTVFKPAFTGKVFSLTTAPLTASIYVSHLSALLSAALALMLLLTLFLFLLMKELTSLFTSQWHMMASDCRNAQSPIKLTQHFHFL